MSKALQQEENNEIFEKEKVFVVVPTFNEARVIRKTLAELVECKYSIVLVDDGSIDGTWELIDNLPVHRIKHQINLGGGAAIKTGIAYALSKGAEYIVVFDADGQHDPDDIKGMLSPIVSKKSDVTLGSRFNQATPATGIPLTRFLLIKMAGLFAWIFTGLWLSDSLNGLRAFSRKAAGMISLFENRETVVFEILDQISKHNLSFEEVSVMVRYSEYSLSKGLSNSSAIRISLQLLVWKFLKQPS